LNPELVDSHCHLDQLPDPAAAIQEAKARAVSRIVAVSESADSMPAVLELKQNLGPSVLAALGMHPAWITQYSEAEIEAGLEYLSGHLAQADALGEVGLDHKWATTEAEQREQARILDKQLELAAEHGKAINMHSRRCQRQVMERAIAFRRETGLNAQLHWFTHSKKLARICNDEGIYISAGPGIVGDIQALSVVSEVADELLLLETDAPVAIGGIPGHPGRTREVAEAIAGFSATTWDQVGARTTRNFRRYAGLDSG
jgi:TatD DNase family protein